MKSIIILHIMIILFCMAVIHEINTLPIVYWSNTQNKCVKVFKDSAECDCSVVDLINDKYERVIVK